MKYWLLGMVVLLARPADAKLVDISLAAFRERAPCGVIVEVSHTATSGSGDNSSTDLVVQMAVVQSFGEVSCELSSALTVHFSTEKHSSHPSVGERAILFPKRQGEELVEAVYGRSYWQLTVLDNEWFVNVTWRNDFLLFPIEIQSGERALIPLQAVERLWEDRETPMP